ncbi:MAG TPA: hypothetical protein VGM92_14475 [Candidatus Kapabacteria bacterium]|jgi:hypothetical protein
MKPTLFFFLILLCTVPAFAQEPSSEPNNAKLDSLKKQAAQCANSGDYGHAVELAKQIIGMGDRDSSLYFLTAIGLVLDGKKSEGKRYYDTAMRLGYDAHTQTATMLGLNTPPADLNYDSAFAAVHNGAVQKSKHLPEGYKNAALYRIYLEDQGERMVLVQDGLDKFLHDTVLLLRMVHNDSVRKKEIYAMLPKLRNSHSPNDLEEACLILQHGDDTTDYRNAHELAMRAIHLGDTSTNARQLAAITLDRYLVKQGKPQRYGTQSFTNEKTGELELFPVDP